MLANNYFGLRRWVFCVKKTSKQNYFIKKVFFLNNFLGWRGCIIFREFLGWRGCIIFREFSSFLGQQLFKELILGIYGRTFWTKSFHPSPLTLVALGFHNYVKPWGRQICPTIKEFENMVETNFFKVCHSFHYIKIIIVKVGLAKQNFLKKNYGGKTLGGADLPLPPPPPPPGTPRKGVAARA